MKVRNLRDQKRILVPRLEDIPSLEDDPEAEFWETHDLSEELLESLPDAPELDILLTKSPNPNE